MAVGKTQTRCEGCRCVAGGEQSEAGSVEPVECKVGLVESIDPNQGIEGVSQFQTQESREEKAGLEVKRSEGDVANEL